MYFIPAAELATNFQPHLLDLAACRDQGRHLIPGVARCRPCLDVGLGRVLVAVLDLGDLRGLPAAPLGQHPAAQASVEP
jgi:hypothetical protein